MAQNRVFEGPPAPGDLKEKMGEREIRSAPAVGPRMVAPAGLTRSEPVHKTQRRRPLRPPCPRYGVPGSHS